MEHGVGPTPLYYPQRPFEYWDSYPPFAQPRCDPGNWMNTLASLRDQQGYLEHLLSKTATTLNALRDRQTRNERALSTNPRPRAKKKKILQNRWRTDKTIKTCENEERVIVNCLQACRRNINTLEAVVQSTAPSTAAEYVSCAGYCYTDTASTATEFDWNGWADDNSVSPFQKHCHHSFMVDEVAPDSDLKGPRPDNAVPTNRKGPPVPPLARSTVPPPPPNTARPRFYSLLSPEAACFEPSVTGDEFPCTGTRNAIDKLSISGLLASKRVQRLQSREKRRFSDAALSHIFRRLSVPGNAIAGVTPSQRHASWTPEVRPTRFDNDAGTGVWARSQSV